MSVLLHIRHSCFVCGSNGDEPRNIRVLDNSGDKFTFQDIAEEAEAIGAGQVYGSVTRVLKELIQTGQVLEMPVLLSSSRGRPQKAFQFD